MKKTSHIAFILIWLVLTLPIAFAQDMANATAANTTTPPAAIEIRNINLLFENERTTFTWMTNVPTTSTVDTGRTISLGNTTADAALLTNHSVSIQTQSGTEYFYRLTSCTAAGACKVSPTQNFFAGKLFVTADIPRYSKSRTIDVAGRTRPGASVTISLNGADVRKSTTQRGDFLFRDVQLATGVNNVTLLSALGAENATLNTLTEIDSAPASMNVSLTPTATAQPLIVNVTVSEPVNLTITVKPQGEAPLRPGDLSTTDIQAAKVSLQWSDVTSSVEYAVYRDGLRLATTSSSEYIDAAVSAGKTYQYQVSAVAKNCVESDKSDLAIVATPNGTARPDTFAPVKLSCASEPQQLFLKEGRSSASVSLREGENLIEFRALDKAGYVTLVEERVVYDTGPPRFLETNLRQLSPTYQQSVNVNGKLSEAGSVTAILNGKPHKTVLTNPDGTFSIPVKLERSASLQANATRVIGQIVWANKIKLQAADAVGLTATTADEQIDYQLCGSGTKVQVELSTPTPQILNPRLLMQGVQTIGMSFKYKYAGGQTANIDKNQIKVTPVALSPEVSKNYDNGLVRYTNKPLGVRTTQRGVKNEGQGYVQFTFGGIDNPWEQLPELRDEKQPANATTQAKLEAIAKHRSDECLVPGFGCMKLFFELEIPFQETVGPLSTDPLVRRTSETTKTTPQVQRSCLAVEVPIDIPIPPRYIPKGLLQATAEILTSIIEGIDKILKPIETIGKYLFYSCLAGQAISLVPIFLEKYNCEFSSVFSSATNEGKFRTEFASIGACDEQYSGQGQDQSKTNCNSCQNAKERRAEVDFLYRRLCDRVMCPSAPSLQYYLKQNANQQLVPVPAPVKAVTDKFTGSKYYSDSNAQLYVGSDCAAWVKSKQKSEAAKRTREPPRLFFSYNEVKGIYTDWLKHQTDDGDTQTSSSEVNCDGLHPASPECCGFQYMEEWSSACGLGTFNFLDTYDEIKESTCLSAEKSGQSSVKLDAVGTTPAKEIECGGVLNSIGGFCDPDGSEAPHTIRVTQTCCDGTAGSAIGLRAQTAAAKENYLYVLLLPRSAQTVAPQGATTGEYDVRLGTVQESVEVERAPTTPNADQRHRINANLEAVEIDSSGIAPYFTPTKIDEYNQKGQLAASDVNAFTTELCRAAGYEAQGRMRDCTIDGNDIYNQVMAVIGTPDQEYIIRPGDGLVNSLRCVCVPTLIAFLKRWRGILGAVRDCMNSILLTGDGSAGVCQAVVSQHACDLLYDAIACFTQKFSKPSGGRAGPGGIGNVMGALTATGQELSRSAQSRYGESPIYRQVFVDKKLVHSICLFAFTGTWNFDVDAVFDAAVDEVPTKSYGLMYPCSRRFVAFNPATRPAGLVSWQYQFGAGLAAGSQVENIELVLKCSGGFKCRESDGFTRGKCDCETPKEITINPENMPTQAKNGEIVNEELFTIIEGAPGEGQIRYDKAYLRWTWNDGKQTRQDKTEECTISTDGGPGNVPSECRFDPLSLAFRCSIGDAGDGIQFLDAVARPSLNIPSGPVFAVGQEVDAELRVRQTLIDATGVSGGKFIQYSVKTAGGREVAKNDALLPVTKNGDYTLNAKTDFGIPPRVSPSWFGSGGTGQSATREIKQWSSTRNEQTVTPASELFADLSITDENNQAWPGQYHFIVEIELDASKREHYKLYAASSAMTDVDRVSGLKSKGSALPGTSSSGILGRTIEYLGSTAASAGTADRSVVVPKIRLTLTRAPLGLQEGEKRQLLVSYGLPTVTNACDSESGQTSPQAFTLTYTAFDSTDFGQPSEQISFDPATDEPVVKTVQFNAICAREGDPTLTRVSTSTQTATLADKLRRIQELLEPLVATQREGKRIFKEVVDASAAPPGSTPLTAQQLQQNRIKLFRALEQTTERYFITQEQLPLAVKNFNDDLASSRLTGNELTKATETKTTLDAYSLELKRVIDVLGPLRERVRNMDLEPEQTDLYNAATIANNNIDNPKTDETIQKIGGVVGIADKVYQLFTGQDAFRYEDKTTSILYRNPATGATKKWTYFSGEQVYKTDPISNRYSVFLVNKNRANEQFNVYELFYDAGTLQTANMYKEDGTLIGPATPNDMPLIRQLDASKTSITAVQILPLINSARTTPTPPPPSSLTGEHQIYSTPAYVYNSQTNHIRAIFTENGIPTVKNFNYDAGKGIYRTGETADTTYSAINLFSGANEEIYYEANRPAQLTSYDNAGEKRNQFAADSPQVVGNTVAALKQKTDAFKISILNNVVAGTAIQNPPAQTIGRLEKAQRIKTILEQLRTELQTQRAEFDRLRRLPSADISKYATDPDRATVITRLSGLQTTYTTRSAEIAAASALPLISSQRALDLAQVDQMKLQLDQKNLNFVAQQDELRRAADAVAVQRTFTATVQTLDTDISRATVAIEDLQRQTTP